MPGQLAAAELAVRLSVFLSCLAVVALLFAQYDGSKKYHSGRVLPCPVGSTLSRYTARANHATAWMSSVHKQLLMGYMQS